MMSVELTVELDQDELTALAKLAGVSFLSGDDIIAQLQGIVKRELGPGVDLGTLFRLTYYREEPQEEYGLKLYTHVFQGPYWPHVVGRPRMYWDGRQIRTRGGSFTVDGARGILDKPPGRGRGVRK